MIGVIELDDSSHKRDSRREADQFVNRVLAAAGVPIVRIPARRGYSPAEIREQVLETLKSETLKPTPDFG